VNDWIGQINAAPARSTLIRASLVGIIAALGVISTDLPKIVDTLAPLGAAIAFIAAQISRYLDSGDAIPTPPPLVK